MEKLILLKIVLKVRILIYCSLENSRISYFGFRERSLVTFLPSITFLAVRARHFRAFCLEIFMRAVCDV